MVLWVTNADMGTKSNMWIVNLLSKNKPNLKEQKKIPEDSDL